MCRLHATSYFVRAAYHEDAPHHNAGSLSRRPGLDNSSVQNEDGVRWKVDARTSGWGRGVDVKDPRRKGKLTPTLARGRCVPACMTTQDFFFMARYRRSRHDVSRAKIMHFGIQSKHTVRIRRHLSSTLATPNQRLSHPRFASLPCIIGLCSDLWLMK